MWEQLEARTLLSGCGMEMEEIDWEGGAEDWIAADLFEADLGWASDDVIYIEDEWGNFDIYIADDEENGAVELGDDGELIWMSEEEGTQSEMDEDVVRDEAYWDGEFVDDALLYGGWEDEWMEEEEANAAEDDVTDEPPAADEEAASEEESEEEAEEDVMVRSGENSDGGGSGLFSMFEVEDDLLGGAGEGVME